VTAKSDIGADQDLAGRLVGALGVLERDGDGVPRIDRVVERNVAAAAGKGAAVGAAAGVTMGGAKGMSDTEVQYQIREDLQRRTLEKRAIPPHEVAHGFIFFPGEAKGARELRISIRATDTRQVYPLIMKF